MDGVVSGRGESFPISSARKEWRVVSEHPNSADKEVDHPKLGQSDERMVYEVQQGREPADVDFCSITIDGCLEDDLLQQRLNSISRQRDHLQQMEIELRAQVIARSEIVGMQNSFDAQIKEQANAALQLQDKLHEREQTIHNLERKIEEKDREIQKIKLDNEAAWAKEDLLREQNKELASFRRERDNAEAERARHIQEIHELQEHIQEKDRQLLDLQEQHRGAQDAILYRDEQLREAQTWMARVQMDALQSNLNHSLQVQLRERTEQCNQLWDNCQRQFVEMERLHMHIQQLQLELAEARERSGTYNEESHVTHVNSKDVSHFAQNNGGQLDANGSSKPNGNAGVLSNGNVDGISSYASIGTTSGQADGVAGVPIAPSLLGMPPYLQPGQMTALHPFVVHQQGISNSVTSHIPQFHSVPAVSSAQHWQNQQGGPESSQISGQDQFTSTQTDQILMRTDAQYNYETSINGQNFDSDYINGQISHGVVPDSEIPSTGVTEVQETLGNSYLVDPQPQPSLHEISSQFHDALRLNRHDKSSESQDNVAASTDYGLQSPDLTSEQPEPVANASPQSEAPVSSVKFGEVPNDNRNGVILPEAFVPAGLSNASVVEKEPESLPLDERSLLACIVRTIPAGGRIRISSTLPNRLGKMLAPLHWHEYKRKYGKLEDFVAAHPELFVIERDFIQLREGAQKMIAATAAAAKVAAAAAAASYPHSSLLPSMAVTPMAQSFRPKKIPSGAVDHSSLPSASHNQHLNGVNFSIAGGVSSVKILSKSSSPLEFSGPSGQPSISMAVGNGANHEGSAVSSNTTKGSMNGRGGANFDGKQQGRTSAAASVSRR